MNADNGSKKPEYTWPKVAGEVALYAFRLIDSGRIVPVVVLALIAVLFVVVLRMEPSHLEPFAERLLSVIASRAATAGVPTAVALYLAIAWRADRRACLKEIERLGKEKQRYVHEDAIPKHSSSQYIWPGESEKE